MCCFWSNEHKMKPSSRYPAFSGPNVPRGRRGFKVIKEKGDGRRGGNTFKCEPAHWKVVGGR